jgi:L-methionine (R)-S-oxide reductase
MEELRQKLTVVMNNSGEFGAASERVLNLVLAHFKSDTGTIHLLDPEKKWLLLVAQIGLPATMLKMVETIPVGKGIAGQTVERGGPVTICNLQTDTSGVAPPGARKTGVGSALCVPVRNDGGIIGTIGIGTVKEREYTPDETKLLEDVGVWIGAQVRPK